MKPEQLCPHCKRVHYSIYTAERCAALHQVAAGMAGYINKERKKRDRPMPLPASQKLTQPGQLN